MARSRPVASAVSFDSDSESAGKPGTPALSRRLLGDLRDWVIVAWVLWWSWAYVQCALAHRFPQLLGWAKALW
jgi:hypothetical protein